METEQIPSKHVKQEAESKAMVPLHTMLFRLSSPRICEASCKVLSYLARYPLSSTQLRRVLPITHQVEKNKLKNSPQYKARPCK